ncbi:MAG: cytidylate kinase-like family protein [Desulfoprunum sp.]|nr:cytidylate kinase-like family protein [Desulfoprunum sp.]
MSIVSISRGSYYRGSEVAHKVADILGYVCISRDTILESSKDYDIPEIKVMHNLQYAVQTLERLSFGRERYIHFISATILRFLKKDNHVYHGLAGQFFLHDVGHVVKVRIIADMEERVAAEADRAHISPDQARLQLKIDDEERRKWAMLLYGIDIVDPSLYDMVLNISSMSTGDAAALIVQAAGLPCYQPTETSVKRIQDLALSAEVKAALFDFPTAGVFVDSGRVHIDVKAPEEQSAAIEARIASSIRGIEGLGELEIRIAPYY